MSNTLFTPLTLPNGQVIGNRIAKAAMEENLSADEQLPSAEHRALYRAWAEGGAGLILTGNVMVAPDHVTSPHGIVLDADQPVDAFGGWAEAASARGAQAWMQINHTGRQMRADLETAPLAPSPLSIPSADGLWAAPREMTEEDIERAIQQFVDTARRAVRAGFTGVQIHGAHGYLISQFLSPLANRRTDRWGGSLPNRSRFLFEVLGAVRAAIPAEAALSLKLNTADFQRGGFDQHDAVQVVRALNGMPVDLLELSGGNVESPAMHGSGLPASSASREAHFLSLVGDIRRVASMPLMLTGGVRSRRAAEEVLADGIEMVGVGAGLAFAPDLPELWRRGEHRLRFPDPDAALDPALRSAQKQAWVRWLLRARAAGRTSDPDPDFDEILRIDTERREARNEEYRAWLRRRSARTA